VLRGRWRIEAEAVGVGGHIGEAFKYGPDPEDSTRLIATSLGRVLLREWGATLVTEYKALPNKVTLGAELGLASGDSAPGFGVDSSRTATDTSGNAMLPPYGSIDGPQYGQPGDNAIRNYRFNPGYRVDLILWRQIIGQVTDAWYLKPKIRWDILPGLAFDGSIIYSQMLTNSGPDATAVDATTAAGGYTLAKGGSKALGAEVDGKLTLDSGNGFAAWTEIGLLQPFSGLGPGSLSRAWALGFGLAAKF
jgi:uncharacterized protein (TIGR04551 family)